MNVLYLFVVLSLQLKPISSAVFSKEFMIYSKTNDKCMAIELNDITKTSCDVHSQQQMWRWTPFSQLQNMLTLECLSAPNLAKIGDLVKMAKCDRSNASQLWNWQDEYIILHGRSLRLNTATDSVTLQLYTGPNSKFEVYGENDLDDETVTNGCPEVCRNDGLCIPQNSSNECHCPCGQTGETCEAVNWCPDVKFSKVGCLPFTQIKPEFFAIPSPIASLKELACNCAKNAGKNGLKYFSLGETKCTGFNDSEISIENISPAQCQQQDQNDCSDSETLPACHGRSGFHYVYELSLYEQLKCEEEIHDCSDYDYIVRAQDIPKDRYFGPIPDAFPAGESFSFCIWMKVAYNKVSGKYHDYMLISYSVRNVGNHFCVVVLPGSAFDSDTFTIFFWMHNKQATGSFSRPGGIFNNWHHICIIYDIGKQTATIFMDGELLGEVHSPDFDPVKENGLLIVGRDQDAYWGNFGYSDMFLGDVTLFNVWNYLISPQEVEQIYSGPGTERGNHLAWVDIKKYVHGYGIFRDSPVLKLEGGGCRWEQRDCNGEGICKGGLFRCPCSSNLTAPRSCRSSDMYETKPCSDNDYYLEFPSTYTRARMKLDNFVLHRTWQLTICVWIKFPPGSSNDHSVVFFGVPEDPYTNFHLYLRSDQKGFAIHGKALNDIVWDRTETYANNEWFHLCAIQDFKKFQMYEDGEHLGDQTEASATTVFGHNEVYIGDSPTESSGKWSFIGSMAHLNIWDTALSSTTIASIASGGKIYVGNLFGWPDLIKYAVPGTISVRRPSPVMTWTDTECQWSKATCVAGQKCSNAKYVCPPLQLNEVLPHSCAVSSYDMDQDDTLKPHLVVNLLLVSRSRNTMKDVGIEYSSVFVNNYEHKLGGSSPMMDFVVLDALTGSFITKFACSVFIDVTCGDKLTADLNKIRIERIVLMVVTDTAGPHFDSAIPAMRSTFGAELHITSDLELRQPFSMVGYSGFNDVSWRESKVIPVSSKPLIIKKDVPLFRESCLDHMYMGERKNGKYVIYPRGGKEMTVYCDFTINGGGWTTIQRRNKGGTVFPVSVNAYENGFGSVDGEFWLGNKKIHRLGEGQMLAIAYENASSINYDHYYDFYVDHSSYLHVSGRSGTAAQGFIDTTRLGAKVFAAPKGLENPSSCVKPSDGGWWFSYDSCDGVNLNAEKKECAESWLGTEMLFRPRLPSHDIVIKEISMKMTYQDGMDACLNDGLRLCSSMEICRNGMDVTGGSVRDIYWVPIADYYNRWINIGSEDEDRLCEIEYNPDWGTDGLLQEYKGKSYCCKHYVGSGTSNAGLPIKVIMPDDYTYDDAVKKCEDTGHRLCTDVEICPSGDPVDGGKPGLDKWVPYAGTHNAWIQVGDPNHLCLRHERPPNWGTDGSVQPYKDVDVYCCSNVRIGFPIEVTMPDTYTFDDAVEKCKETGHRLCTNNEICPSGGPAYGTKAGVDKWTPYYAGDHNSWIQVGDGHSSVAPCALHASPGWGMDRSVQTYKDVKVYCCSNGPSRVSKYIVPNTYSYMDGMEECAKKRQRLCTSKEICPDDKTPAYGVMDSNVYARVLDRNNDWITIGNDHSPCTSYLEPSWGTTDQASQHKPVLFCCPLIYEGRIARTWKYDLKFNGNLSYVRLPMITPLPNATVCWWMLLNVGLDMWKTVFLFQTFDTGKQLFQFAVKSDGSFQLTVGNTQRTGEFPGILVDNHEYHHICVLWNWLTGVTRVYRDGTLVSSFLLTDASLPAVPPSKSLLIGQSYIDSTSKSFDPDKSFIGVITRFNIWDYELKDSDINKQSLVCGEEEGSIIAWPEVKLWTFDGLEVIEQDDCFPENCLDYLFRNKITSGMYEIRPLKNESSFRVYCDQDTGTGGWINIGRRDVGTLTFYDKSFKEFRNGFGYSSSEFWLGHQKIHMLTSAQIQHSLLTVKNEHDRLFSMQYEWFMLEREDADYKLRYSSPTGDDDELLVGKPFVTEDHDSDDDCGDTHGSYWHKNDASCLQSNLFGKHGEGGPMGAQWMGRDSGEVNFWQWRIKSSHELKQMQPVIYWTDSDSRWGSSEAFCDSKGVFLCEASELCSPESDPFGAYLYALRRTPIRDGFNKWLNIGEQSSCSKVTPPDGNNDKKFPYKRRVICCHGYPKRDWRYDLRFSEGSKGFVKMTSTAYINEFTICWWLRTISFTQSAITVFTIHFDDVKLGFSLSNDGTINVEFNGFTNAVLTPSSIDGKWHHYCLVRTSNYIDVFFDGIEIDFVPLGNLFGKTLDGGQLYIGQNVDQAGNIIDNNGLVGVLTRFNFWLKEFKVWDVKQMAKHCGGDVGTLVAWPEVKYYIVGDVERTLGTTCVKPDKHFWPFNVVDDGENAYKDVLGEYNLKLWTNTSQVEPGKVFRMSEEDGYISKLHVMDDCITDPQICHTTGLTVGLWLKRKGLRSKILPESDVHYLTFLKWLDAAVSGASDWLICYNHTGPNMNISAFHEGCDYVGATVTLVKVGDYVFGGFANENWGGDARYIASHSSFLFSLHNPSNVGPVKFEVIADQNASALYTSNELGPTFGKNHDLKLTSTESSSSLGQTYRGTVAGPNVAESFFTTTELFTVDEIEVFYAYVRSEAVGVQFRDVIKDEQMTASNYELPNAGPHNARLHNPSSRWRASSSDSSPWLQVKLNDVAKIIKIAIQGCGSAFVELFRLLYSMDGINWTTYKENFTEKVLTGNTDSSNSVKYNTLENAVETKYVRISVVQFSGSHVCMRTELYKAVSVCPTANDPVVSCSKVNVMTVAESMCTSFGCCFVNSQCVSKKQEIQAVGMESGSIPNESITASSWTQDFRPFSARFKSGYKGWESDITDFPQWLQVELNKDEILTHVATQGATVSDEVLYCKSYKLYYRKAFGLFVVYKENGYPRVFEGYPLLTKTIKNLFLNPFVARYVRLYPQQIPTGYVCIELYRALEDYGTSVIATTYDSIGRRPTGISLEQRSLMTYHFAVQADTARWEIKWQWITYQWTHLIFSWHENTGIHFYENGILKMHSEKPSQFTEARFLEPSQSFIVGRNSKYHVTHIFEMANLFMLKRSVLPYEAKSLVYNVPCGFGDISQCNWSNTTWKITDAETPSGKTGPEEGVKIWDSSNLALGKILKATETLPNSSFAVDGLLKTCAVLNAQTSVVRLSVDLGEPRKVGQVVIFNIHDPERRVQYNVAVSTIQYLDTCEEEFNYIHKEHQTVRSFKCTQFFDANVVSISNKDSTMPLTLCEVAIYTTASDKFAYMESSYPTNKSFSGILTTTYFSQYNCLHFSYHMHGKDMGRLNVFGPELIGGNRTLLWRLAGDQGNEWRTGTVRLEASTLQHFHEITFEAVVGDGYTSDIAVDNIVFSVDGQCSTYPATAIPTVSVTSPEEDCLCLNSAGSSSESLNITTCNTLSQGLLWQLDGVIMLQEKCLRPADDDVIDGTKLVWSTSCEPNEVAFQLTPPGAIKHLSSSLCIQSAELKNRVEEGDVLALGSHGCYDVKWSWTTVLLKDRGKETYFKHNVLKLGLGAMPCRDYDGSLFRFIPANVKTTLPGTSVVSYNQSTNTYRLATVDELNENRTSFVVSWSETESSLVSPENTTKTLDQPIRGSSILGTQSTPTRVLSEWLAESGVFSEFWRPCVYLTEEGTSKFNCSLEDNVPTLLLIRKDRVLVGGYMAHNNSKPNANFLFSLKESSSLPFKEAFGFGAGNVVLTESEMTFGNDELAINWNAEPAVENRPGSMFGITDLNSMVGEGQFSASDFEVLQPRDEICAPRCKAQERCDQITGKCICDLTGRPPAWCLKGAAGKTIYEDAGHYWSMDSKLKILDEKADNSGWALVEGDLEQNIGVNGLCVEVEDNNGKIELLSDDHCFERPRNCYDTGFTISFWFKNVLSERSNINNRIFLQTSYDVHSHTGLFMHQGSNSEEIVFKSRNNNRQCVFTFNIEPNLWTFVTFVNTEETWVIFVNGISAKAVEACAQQSSDKNSDGKLILANGGRDTIAMFDDVAVWYRALPEHEVVEIYRYYYKEPPTLTASLEVKFNDISVTTNELADKESAGWKSVEDGVNTKFGAFFPAHESTSFFVDKCRVKDSHPICNVLLTLNGSDYKMVEKLENEDVIPYLEILDLKTDKVHYNATVLTGTSPEASKINLTWAAEMSNLYQGFLITYVNNKTNETFNATVNTFASSYELNNLTGYSHYIIRFAFYTLAGIGKWTQIVVETEEDVPKYPPSNLTGHNASSTELFLTWDAVPEENTYQEMRGYVVYVIDADTSLLVKNITTNSSTIDVHIDDLRKFRTYSLYVRAYTIDVGVQSITMNLTTSEDAPDAPPDDVQVFNSSSTSLRIEFNPVNPDMINGILRGYRVFYWKTREGNLTRKNFTITKEPGSNSVIHKRQKRSAGQYHEGYPLFADIFNLEEYTNYTVQIQAITILDGVLAPPFTTLTAEDLPSMAPPNVTARNTSSTSILLEWDLIPEDDRNGIILGYMVYYTGRDGVERIFAHHSTNTFLNLRGLEKFTDYIFELTVFNSIGESNRSEVVSCKTDQDRPDLPPQDIVGTPISPSTMGIVWKPVPFPFERGIILGYRFVFSTMSGEVLDSKILPPDEDFIIVRDLEIFTNYTVNMTAFTIKGDGPWSSKVVLSLQIAPTIPPLNLTADSFYSLNSLPVHWIKVPPELTKGYIIGYRLYIKPVTVGLEEVPDTRATEIVLKGQPSSYVFKDLDFFTKFKIYLIAYTVGGDSPRSNTIYAETCRCGPVLSTQWANLAPYTNITNPEYYDKKILKNIWGIFPYIVKDAVTFCCQTCKSHNYSSVSFSRNYRGQPSEVFDYEALVGSIDGLTDLTFPVYGYVGMEFYHSLYKFTPLIESPGSAFLVRKEESDMSGLLMSNILGNWPLAVLIVSLALAAGAVMWCLEKSKNSEEFPPAVLRGIVNGFWWAYVTMTTVGYGDRSPRTTLGRIFAIVWTLTGLVVTGIMVGDLASSLTISVSPVEKIIYGAKVGALDLSPEFRLGVRLNAKMNTVRPYQSLDELYRALLSGEVDGILLDAYIVGSRKDLFKNPKILVNKIKDYRSAYGIVWAGKSARMKVCLDWYMKSRKSMMFDHIAENLEMVRKIDKIDAQEELANIFDPTTKLFTRTLFISVVALSAVLLLGLIYELIRRRRLATKVQPHGENEVKNQSTQSINNCVYQITTEIVHKAQAMKTKHIQQLRGFKSRSWFKKSKVCPSTATENSEIIDDIT